MNENKVDWLGRIQQSHGLKNGDLINSEFGNRSSCQYFDVRSQQGWNMGTSSHQLAMSCGGGGGGLGVGVGVGGGAEQQSSYIGPSKSSSSTIISRFESPASAFYATEIFMGFPQYDCQVGGNTNPSLVSQFSKNNNDLEFPLYQSSSSKETLFLDSSNNQPSPHHNFELSNNTTLQAMKSQLNSDQCCRTPEKSNNIVPCGNFHGSNFLPMEQHKLFIDDVAAAVTRSPSIPSKGNQDHAVAIGSYNLPVAQLSFSSQQEKLSPTLSAGSVSLTSSNSASIGPVVSSKTRIRWTQDLHEKFVECVNRLGGAEKATPKAILRLMESDGLTIFHVKSHLQKYRIAKYMPEPTQGKSDKRVHAENVHLDVKTGFQIREALQLQLDVQRRLHEQLEIQRKLQLRIEEQGKQLKIMFDQQQQKSTSLLDTKNLGNTDNNNENHSYKDVEVTRISEGSGNSFLHSKIS